MKIGVVTASYPRVEGEYAGNFVAAHVAALRAAGHDVEVIGAHTIASELFYAGGAPDALERGGVRAYLAAARFSAQLTLEVARRARHWDLVIAHWLAPSALAAILGLAPAALGGAVPARLRRMLRTTNALATSAASTTTPILAIAHGGDVHTLRRLHLLAPALFALRARGVRLAFVSEELRDIARAAAPRLASWLDEQIVQPMGIDVARFAALRTTAADDSTSSNAHAPTTHVGTESTRGTHSMSSPTTHVGTESTRGTHSMSSPTTHVGTDSPTRGTHSMSSPATHVGTDSPPTPGTHSMSSPTTHVGTDAPTIVVIARLVPVKGVDVAIRAMQLAHTPARLIIAGDGPDRTALEQLATPVDRSTSPAGAPRHPTPSSTSNASRIEFVGTIDASQCDDLLRRATCLVIPSRVLPNGRTEGTPMIALEALAAGVPVIASAVGGLRDLPGITRVRPDDPHALAAAIDRVLHDPLDGRHEAPISAFELSTLDWPYVSERLLAHAIASAFAASDVREPSICETGDTTSRRTA